MNSPTYIHHASVEDAPQIAIMVGELLHEIMGVIGVAAFNFDEAQTKAQLIYLIKNDKYFPFIARDEAENYLGFITLCESYALYAEGVFGTIPELYVRPAFRSQKIGFNLLQHAKKFGKTRDWKRLEVTTPPLPQFDKTIAFYEREGFTVAGGRKLKILL
ncbi:GNAT family N-acetyltransferase [Sulfuriferula nivalis]|uniref:Acetyltransferase n=1 Tax=Sulfuriferula nivalis TaxID=2675298 RepID=A0A809SA78_9PROT|nr:GNAT family N-acetyltransferase [Sulfuriferula nivalis]BBP01412.1 acetyltransferase [Sulfuriferula nivalis]